MLAPFGVPLRVSKPIRCENIIIVFINYSHVSKAFLEPAVSSSSSHSPKQSRIGHGCLDGLSRSDNRLGPIKVCCRFQVLKVCLEHCKPEVVATLNNFIYLYPLEIKTTTLDLGTHLWESSYI